MTFICQVSSVTLRLQHFFNLSLCFRTTALLLNKDQCVCRLLIWVWRFQDRSQAFIWVTTSREWSLPSVSRMDGFTIKSRSARPFVLGWSSWPTRLDFWLREYGTFMLAGHYGTGPRREANWKRSLCSEAYRISLGLSSSSYRSLSFFRISSHTKRKISSAPATMPVTAPAIMPMLCASVFSEAKAGIEWNIR